MDRRGWLIGLGIASVLLFAAMGPAERRLQDAGGPGILAFELTGGEERAEEIATGWGADGRDAARQSLLIDFGYLITYGAFLVLATAATRDLAVRRGWRRTAAIGTPLVPLGAIAAAFDALENASLLVYLDGGGAALPLLATIFAACKFALLAVVVAYLLVGLGLRLRAILAAAPASPGPPG